MGFRTTEFNLSVIPRRAKGANPESMTADGANRARQLRYADPEPLTVMGPGSPEPVIGPAKGRTRWAPRIDGAVAPLAGPLISRVKAP
jgi:hypothetical protein